MVIVRTNDEDQLANSYNKVRTWTDNDFTLNEENEAYIRSLPEKFTVQGAVTFLRTYARKKKDGTIESWPDAVIRIINATFYFLRQQAIGREWNEEQMQVIARDMGEALFKKQWLPAGRGLWSMEKNYVKRFGSLALNNCYFITTDQTLDDEPSNLSFAHAMQWLMNTAMLGGGVGVDLRWRGTVYQPGKDAEPQFYDITDDREGWAFSLFLLMESYLAPGKGVISFGYSQIRAEGTPIETFGGIAPGPEPLKLLHNCVRSTFDCYYRVRYEGMSAKDSILIMLYEMREYHPAIAADFDTLYKKYMRVDPSAKTFDEDRLIADVANFAGIAVCSGNVRRMSEILHGKVQSVTFLNLKNWEINPEREYWGWMSNNSVRVDDSSEYDEVAEVLPPLILKNGEPGIFNLFLANQPDPKNPQPVDERNALKATRRARPRKRGGNPCNEIDLESGEPCNVPDVFPTNCVDENGDFSQTRFDHACQCAALYGAIVTMIPTFDKRADEVIEENHRVGVCVHSWFVMQERFPYEVFKNMMRRAYAIIRTTIDNYVEPRAGLPAIAHTSGKPGGTTPLVADAISGLNAIIQGRYVKRRITVSTLHPLFGALKQAGVPYETKPNDPTAVLFIFPMDQGSCRTAMQVSPWEMVTLQREVQQYFVNNMISCTHSIHRIQNVVDLKHMIAKNLPYLKGFSFLPHENFRTLELVDGHRLQLNTSVSRDEYDRFLNWAAPYMSNDQYEFGKSGKFVSYDYLPIEAISKEEYEQMVSVMPPIDTSLLSQFKGLVGSDGSELRGCLDSDQCMIEKK